DDLFGLRLRPVAAQGLYRRAGQVERDYRPAHSGPAERAEPGALRDQDTHRRVGQWGDPAWSRRWRSDARVAGVGPVWHRAEGPGDRQLRARRVWRQLSRLPQGLGQRADVPVWPAAEQPVRRRLRKGLE